MTKKNTAAQAFWNRAIASFMGFTVAASVQEIKGKDWQVFSFYTGLRKVN